MTHRIARILRCSAHSSPPLPNCARPDSILAYHDRSDGGLFATLAEMAFAGHCGVEIDARQRCAGRKFSEELGAVLQIRDAEMAAAKAILRTSRVDAVARIIGTVTQDDRVRIRAGNATVLSESRTDLRRAWSQTSYRIVELRDNPACAVEQFEMATDANDPGLNVRLTFDTRADIAAPFISKGHDRRSPFCASRA